MLPDTSDRALIAIDGSLYQRIAKLLSRRRAALGIMHTPSSTKEP
jgi:hypothetical protein